MRQKCRILCFLRQKGHLSWFYQYFVWNSVLFIGKSHIKRTILSIQKKIRGMKTSGGGLKMRPVWNQLWLSGFVFFSSSIFRRNKIKGLEKKCPLFWIFWLNTLKLLRCFTWGTSGQEAACETFTFSAEKCDFCVQEERFPRTHFLMFWLTWFILVFIQMFKFC